ncbi:MAG: regulatory signaling modulator protein AmpE [Gammaproteobacteria bacterium]
MTFIVIVAALLLDQVLRPLDRLRLHPWFEAPLADWAERASAAPSAMQILAALAPSFILAFAVGAIAWGLMAANFVLGFIWAVLVLLFCLGPRNLTAGISAYLKARAAGDAAGARRIAAVLLGRVPPRGVHQCGVALSETALVNAGDELFTVLFWFVLLGPLGAALFRVADVIAMRAAVDRPRSYYAQAANALKQVMAWLPMHLLALTYAIASGFHAAGKDKRDSEWGAEAPFLERGAAIVLQTGRHAIRAVGAKSANEIELLHAAVDLIWRGVVIWLAVIGIIVLLAWVF